MASPAVATVIPLAETLVEFLHEGGDVQKAAPPEGDRMGKDGGAAEKQKRSGEELLVREGGRGYFYKQVEVVSQDGVGDGGDEEGFAEALQKTKQVFFFRGAKVGQFVLGVGDDVVVGEGGGFGVKAGDATHGGIITYSDLSRILVLKKEEKYYRIAKAMDIELIQSKNSSLLRRVL